MLISDGIVLKYMTPARDPNQIAVSLRRPRKEGGTKLEKPEKLRPRTAKASEVLWRHPYPLPYLIIKIHF